jgi:hypothetical protein
MRVIVFSARVFCPHPMGLRYSAGVKAEPPPRITDRYTKKYRAVPRITAGAVLSVIGSVMAVVPWIEVLPPVLVFVCPVGLSAVYGAGLSVLAQSVVLFQTGPVSPAVMTVAAGPRGDGQE